MIRIFLIIFLFLPCIKNFGQQIDLNTHFKFKIDGPVNSIIIDDTSKMMYLGGEFNSIGNEVKHYVRVDPVTGQITKYYPDIEGGRIYQTEPDGNGGFFIVGDFKTVDGRNQPLLAHIDHEGNLTDWGKGLDFQRGKFSIVKRADSLLFLHGEDIVTGKPYQKTSVAFIDPVTGEYDSLSPIVEGNVSQLIADGKGGLIIGGSFSSVNGVARSNLAYVNNRGELTSLFSDINFNGSITTMDLKGPKLYLGGNFTSINSNNNMSIALIGENLKPLNPNISALGLIKAAVADNQGGWYVGGDFSILNGSQKQGIAHIDSNSNVLDWSPVNNIQISSMTLLDDTIYVTGGTFAMIDVSTGILKNVDIGYSNPTAVYNIDGKLIVKVENGKLIEYDPGSNNPLIINTNGTISSVSGHGDTLIISGSFSEINGLPQSNIAAYQYSNNTILNWTPTVNGSISTSLIHEGELFIAGEFTQVNSLTRYGIASFNISNWGLTEWKPESTINIKTIEVLDSILLVGGGSLGNISAQKGLEAFYLESGESKKLDFAVPRWVFALEKSNNKLLIGGNFQGIAEKARPYAACIDLDNGSITDWNPSPNSYVYKILADTDRVYMSGEFTQVGNTHHIYFTAVDDSSGVVFPNWACPEPNNRVYSIIRNDSSVFIGGLFNKINGIYTNSVAEIDKETGATLPWIYSSVIGEQVTFLDQTNSGQLIASNDSKLVVFDKANGELFNSYATGIGSMIEMNGKYFIGGLNISDRKRIVEFDSSWQITDWQPDFRFTKNKTNSLIKFNGKIAAAGEFHINGKDLITGREFFSININTQKFTDWDPGITGGEYSRIFDMLIDGDTAYIAGVFENIGNHQQKGLVAVDTETGNKSFRCPEISKNGNLNSDFSLLLHDTLIFVWGDFKEIGYKPREGVAAINSKTGSVTNWNPGRNYKPLLIKGDTLLVSEGITIHKLDLFQGINIGESYNFMYKITAAYKSDSTIYLGKFAINEKTYLPTNWDPSPEGYINDIHPVEGGILVSGNFNAMGVRKRKSIAAIDLDQFIVSDWKTDISGQINSIAHGHNKLFVGGSFYADGSMRTLGAIDINTGKLIDWKPNINGMFSNMISHNGDLIIEGAFDSGGSIVYDLVTIMDNTTELIRWNADMISGINSMQVYNGSLFIGGGFTKVGGVDRNKLALFDISERTLINWSPSVTGSAVNNLAIDSINNSLIIGGHFDMINEQHRIHLGSVNLVDGSTTQWNPQATTSINGIAVNGTSLIASTPIDYVYGLKNEQLLQFNTISGKQYPWNPNPSGNVAGENVYPTTITATATYDKYAFVSGNFTEFNGQHSPYFGAALLSDNNPPVPQLKSAVRAFTQSQTIEISIDFGENVIGMDESKVMVGGGEIFNFVDIGNGIFNVTIFIPDENIVNVNLDVNGITDLYGNPSLPGNSISTTYDISSPIPVFDIVSDTIETRSYTIGVNFGEEVYDFHPNDILTVNVTIDSIIDLSNGQYEIRISPVDYGEISLSISNHTIVDKAGNWNSEAVSLGTYFLTNTFPYNSFNNDIFSYEDEPTTQISLDDWFEDQEDPDSTLVYSIDSIQNSNLINTAEIKNRIFSYDIFPNKFGKSDIFISILDPRGNKIQHTMRIVVQPVPDLPLVNNSVSVYGRFNNDPVIIQRNSHDSNEITHFVISGIVNGEIYLSDETTRIFNGDYITIEDGLNGLKYLGYKTGEHKFDVQGSLGDSEQQIQGLTANVMIGISKAPLRLIADDKVRPFGTPNPQFTISYEGFVFNDTPFELDTLPNITTEAGEFSNTGTYPIIISSGFDANYELNYEPGSLLIEKAQAFIFFNNLLQGFDEQPKEPVITTTPENLNYSVLFDGNLEAPSEIGVYVVEASIDDLNYYGNSSALFTIDIVHGLEPSVTPVKVYPNPVRNFLNFQWNEENPRFITLINGNGQILNSIEESGNSLTLDFRSYPIGLYIIIIEENNTQSIIKVIKVDQ